MVSYILAELGVGDFAFGVLVMVLDWVKGRCHGALCCSTLLLCRMNHGLTTCVYSFKRGCVSPQMTLRSTVFQHNAFGLTIYARVL